MRLNKPSVATLLAAGVLLLCRPAVAQFNHTTQGARCGALGGCFMPSADERSVQLGWCQEFALDGMADKGLRLQLPTGRSGFAVLAYNHFGSADYHEQRASVGYALRVTPWLHVGVGGSWLHLGTSDAHYRARQRLAADAMLLAGHDAWSVLLLAGTRPWDTQHPLRMHLRTSYRHNAHVLALLALESEDCWRWRMGVEYAFADHFAARVGMATAPVVATFGLGVNVASWRIDLAVEAHSVLGATPQMSLGLCF